MIKTILLIFVADLFANLVLKKSLFIRQIVIEFLSCYSSLMLPGRIEYFENQKWKKAKLFNVKYELFSNKKWIEINDKEIFDRRESNETYRFTEKTKNSVAIKYLNGTHYHRLDGPACEFYLDGILDRVEWYLHGRFLGSFADTSFRGLAKYLKIYPYTMEAVETLARNNNWLTEDQILLLKTIELFK